MAPKKSNAFFRINFGYRSLIDWSKHARIIAKNGNLSPGASQLLGPFSFTS